MNEEILRSSYAKAGGWERDLPMAEVSLKSIYRTLTGEYRGQAVIDSGSDICWVPKGMPSRYGWPHDYQVAPRPVNTLGGRVQANQFVLVIRIDGRDWKVPVCEALAKGFECPIIGQDVLEDLVVLLDGVAKRLTISAPKIGGQPTKDAPSAENT